VSFTLIFVLSASICLVFHLTVANKLVKWLFYPLTHTLRPTTREASSARLPRPSHPRHSYFPRWWRRASSGVVVASATELEGWRVECYCSCVVPVADWQCASAPPSLTCHLRGSISYMSATSMLHPSVISHLHFNQVHAALDRHRFRRSLGGIPSF
jgi:hypothetical protein